MGFQKWIEVSRLDELGRLVSPVHRIDARAKALATAGFVVAVLSFPRYEVAALTPFFVFPIALANVGRIPAAVVVRKLLVAAPFAVAVGLCNPFLDTRPMGSVAGVALTGGWLSFASILLRFALTVSAALVLVACTGMDRLCAGLERLGLPRVFAVQLLFLYRYLFAIADEGARMWRGLELRSADRSVVRLRVYGSLVGHLLVRSMARAEHVYQAMLARGFDGEVRVLQVSRFRASDVLFVCGWWSFFAVARAWNLADVMGSLLVGGVS